MGDHNPFTATRARAYKIVAEPAAARHERGVGHAGRLERSEMLDQPRQRGLRRLLLVGGQLIKFDAAGDDLGQRVDGVRQSPVRSADPDQLVDPVDQDHLKTSDLARGGHCGPGLAFIVIVIERPHQHPAAFGVNREQVRHGLTGDAGTNSGRVRESAHVDRRWKNRGRPPGDRVLRTDDCTDSALEVEVHLATWALLPGSVPSPRRLSRGPRPRRRWSSPVGRVGSPSAWRAPTARWTRRRYGGIAAVVTPAVGVVQESVRSLGVPPWSGRRAPFLGGPKVFPPAVVGTPDGDPTSSPTWRSGPTSRDRRSPRS